MVVLLVLLLWALCGHRSGPLTCEKSHGAKAPSMQEKPNAVKKNE